MGTVVYRFNLFVIGEYKKGSSSSVRRCDRRSH